MICTPLKKCISLKSCFMPPSQKTAKCFLAQRMKNPEMFHSPCITIHRQLSLIPYTLQKNLPSPQTGIMRFLFRTPFFQDFLRICFVPHKSQHFLKCFIPPQIITFFEMFHAPTNHDILGNVSYPHKSDAKMFHTPSRKPGKCFIPRLQILRPGMQVKK